MGTDWIYSRLPRLGCTRTHPMYTKGKRPPPGSSILHAHRNTTTTKGKKQHRGGVAFIHREDIRVKVVPKTLAQPTTFELLLVKIMNCSLGTTIAIIYRPPNSTSKPCKFTTELSDLIDGGSLGESFIICGDLNCPGLVGTKGLVGKELSDLIDRYSLTQHAKDPTHRSENILDHILSPDG